MMQARPWPRSSLLLLLHACRADCTRPVYAPLSLSLLSRPERPYADRLAQDSIRCAYVQTCDD